MDHQQPLEDQQQRLVASGALQAHYHGPGRGGGGSCPCRQKTMQRSNGSGTTSIASRNSKSAGKLGPWRSAKGKVVSSKRTCREMMTIGGEVKAALSFMMGGIA